MIFSHYPDLRESAFLCYAQNASGCLGVLLTRSGTWSLFLSCLFIFRFRNTSTTPGLTYKNDPFDAVTQSESLYFKETAPFERTLAAQRLCILTAINFKMWIVGFCVRRALLFQHAVPRPWDVMTEAVDCICRRRKMYGGEITSECRDHCGQMTQWKWNKCSFYKNEQCLKW